jgi:Mg2+ and Co2+ transporter CorA
MVDQLGDRHLLWIDLDSRDSAGLEAAGHAIGADQLLVERLADSAKAADLTQFEDRIHLVLLAVEPAEAGTAGDLVVRPIDIVGG